MVYSIKEKKTQLSIFIVIMTILILFGVLILSQQKKTGYDNEPFNNYTSSKNSFKFELEDCMYHITRDTLLELFDDGGIYSLDDPKMFLFSEFLYNKSRVLPIYISYDDNKIKLSEVLIKNEIEKSLKNNIGVCFDSFDDLNFVEQEDIINDTNIDIQILGNKIFFDVTSRNSFISENKNITLMGIKYSIENGIGNVINVVNELEKNVGSDPNVEISKINKIAKENNVKIDYLVFNHNDSFYTIYNISGNNINFYFAQKMIKDNYKNNLTINFDRYIVIHPDVLFEKFIGIKNYDYICDVSFNIIENDFKNLQISDGFLQIKPEIDEIGLHMLIFEAINSCNKNDYDRQIMTIEVSKNE